MMKDSAFRTQTLRECGIYAELVRLSNERDSFRTARAYREYAEHVLRSLLSFGLLSSFTVKRKRVGKGLNISVRFPIKEASV